MKPALFFSISLFLFLNAFSQDSTFQKVFNNKKDAERAIKGNRYISSVGWEIKVDDNIKLGKGSMPDKTFAFITEMPNLLTYNQYKDYDNSKLSHTYNGRDAKIADFYVAGTRKSGFYIIAKIKVGQLSRYVVDIENSIDVNELEVPAQYVKIKKTDAPTVVVKQEISVGDELAKLKKLYDDGVLTKEEYELQKKKLLER
jgi:hypothetical protein